MVLPTDDWTLERALEDYGGENASKLVKQRYIDGIVRHMRIFELHLDHKHIQVRVAIAHHAESESNWPGYLVEYQHRGKGKPIRFGRYKDSHQPQDGEYDAKRWSTHPTAMEDALVLWEKYHPGKTPPE